jgi:hypothetical protein
MKKRIVLVLVLFGLMFSGFGQCMDEFLTIKIQGNGTEFRYPPELYSGYMGIKIQNELQDSIDLVIIRFYLDGVAQCHHHINKDDVWNILPMRENGMESGEYMLYVKIRFKSQRGEILAENIPVYIY